MRGATRGILTLGVAALALWGGGGTALAADQGAGFTFTETYRQDDPFLWGPAAYYGRTVTVVYRGSIDSHFENGRFYQQVEGTADVYRGASAEGSPIDSRYFVTEESWIERGSVGWPVHWWSCRVTSLEYRWSIADVYEFTVSSHDGHWTASTTAWTSPPIRGGWESGDEAPIHLDACA